MKKKVCQGILTSSCFVNGKMLLKKIPIDVQFSLCASAQINNYRKVVEELVYNALDADSSSIAVRINTQEYSMQVIDNGHGISKCDFELLGLRHMTSKYVDFTTLKSAPNKYGVRGESLSNIIEISQSVKIISRLDNTDETWSKIFDNGKRKNLKQTTTRPSKGTTVEIKGFLYNLRIKKNALNPLCELQEIKAFMEQISFVHSNISLSLRDDSKNEIIFRIHKKRDVYQTLSTLFNIEKTDVQVLEVEKNKYKVKAFIGKNDKEDGKHWIFVNGKFVHSNSKLHKIINDNMNKNIEDVRKLKSKHLNDNDAENHLIHKKKPFYFILIVCPYIDYDISNTPKQSLLEFRNWEKVTKLLDKLIKFYFGDTKLRQKNNDKSNKHNIDPKSAIKNIMDKFLASNSKKLRVSQMHNGVKGKLTKRKIKKPLKIPLTTLVPPKKADMIIECHGIDTMLPDICTKIQHNKNRTDKQLSNGIIKQNRHNLNDFDDSKKIRHNLKEIKINFANKNGCRHKEKKIKPLISKRGSKIHKMKLTKKQQLKKNNKIRKYNDTRKSILINDPIISKFANPTNSIKKRCRIISEKADEVLHCRNKRNQDVYINEKVKYSNIIKDNKNIAIRETIDEIVIHDYIPPKVDKHNIYSDFKSTYDLVQPVIKSQRKNMCKQRPSYSYKNIESVNIVEKPEFVLAKTPKTNPFISSSTFKSHRYDTPESCKITNVPIGRRLRNVKYMTKQSRDNFIAPNNRYTAEFIDKKNINNSNIKHFTEMISNNCPRTLLYYNINKHNVNETSRTMDFTKSNEISHCNGNHDNLECYNDNLPLSNINYDKINCINASLNMNEVVSLSDHSANKINKNTYTITNTENLYISSETYSINHSYKQHADSHLPNSVIWIDRDIFSQQQDNSNYVLETHSQKSKANNVDNKEIEPQKFCQAIQSSIDIFEDDFEYRSNVGNILNDNVFNIDTMEAIDNEILKDKQNCDIIERQDNVSRHFRIDKTNTVGSKHNSTMKNQIVKSNPNQISEYVQDNFNNNQLPDIESNQTIKATEFNDFDLKNRLRFMPKGMSPIFDNCNSKVACNYNLESDYYEDDLYINFINDVQINLEVFEPNLQNVKDVTRGDIDKSNSRLKNDDDLLKFDGQSLKTVKVLGQVDDKFIAAIMKGRPNQRDEISEFLVLFDQHAVHERIRLEKNLSDYINNDEWKSVTLDNVSMKMSKDVVLYLHNYKDKFVQLGLQWNIQINGDIAITAIPEAILGKNPRQVDKIIRSVKNLIAEEINIIKLQRGCVSLYPKSIMDLVCSEACRYAIKFGDKLTKSNCVELLNLLSECKTPFQCAHGRPAMAVLVENKSMAREYEVNLRKVNDFIGKFEKQRKN